MNVQEIVTKAQESFTTLYDKYGIKPNAFMISESLIKILWNEMRSNVTMTEFEKNLRETTSEYLLWGIPVYPIAYPAGVVKATIILE